MYLWLQEGFDWTGCKYEGYFITFFYNIKRTTQGQVLIVNCLVTVGYVGNDCSSIHYENIILRLYLANALEHFLDYKTCAQQRCNYMHKVFKYLK